MRRKVRSRPSGARRFQVHMVGVRCTDGSFDFSTEDLLSMYVSLLEKGRLKPGTRQGYQRALNKVRLFCVSHGLEREIMPMKPKILKALLLELVLVGETINTFKNVLSALSELHRAGGCHGAASPIIQAGGFMRLLQRVAPAGCATRQRGQLQGILN